MQELLACLNSAEQSWPEPCLLDLKKKLSGPQAHLVRKGLPELAEAFGERGHQWFRLDPHRFLRLAQMFAALEIARQQFVVERALAHFLFQENSTSLVSTGGLSSQHSHLADDWSPLKIPQRALELLELQAVGNLRGVCQMNVVRQFCSLNAYREYVTGLQPQAR